MSLKGDKYETAEEIRFRLEGTLVKYDGDPVYITRVNMPEADDGKEIARVFFRKLPYKNKDQEVRKYLSSRKFDLTPFKMGYFNHNKQAFFVSRNPVRQNKQGLSADTTILRDVRGKPCGDMSFALMTTSDGFVDMLNNKYPDFKDAVTMLDQKDNSSVALTQTFAFNIDHDLEALVLMHKGTRCGLAMREDRALKIPKKFHFLREELEENRIPIA